ncbi:hypothetical protein [Pseudonocardia sp.]|uniref:hypothetical protein n=1 Tax=Pseudonocardia sp. TaxID=60912 RepID=UPI003D0FA8EF
MGKKQQTITTTDKTTAEENAGRGLSSVCTLAARVAGFVPTRVDMRFAGTPEQQLGITLGTVLVYVNMHRTAATIADKWAAAAPLARGLSHALPQGRRDATVTAGPWLLSAMVRFAGTPAVTASMLTPQPGRDVPPLLRMQVGPVTWELADAVAYTSMLNAWRIAEDLLACGKTPTE